MALRDRTRWHLGANAPVAAWLAAVLAITLVRRYVPESPWLLVHLLLLGAVTNAIFVWSSHFADALLRRRATPGSRRWQAARMLALNVGVLTVVAGMVTSAWILTLAGSVVVGTAAAAHGITLALQARSALASRFGATVRYYIYASLALPIGIAQGAERVARQALPILVGSVVLAAAGALFGLQTLAAAGVAAYLGGVLWAIRPLAQVAHTKVPSAYATWSVMAALIWLVGSLLGLVTILANSSTWRSVTDHLGLLIIPLAAGFAAQVLLGALSFLVPVVLGGGPNILRGTQARMDRGNALRAVLINAGLMICVLPVPSLVRLLVSVLVVGAFAAFLPLLVFAVLHAVRAKRVGERSDAGRSPAPTTS